MLRYKLSSIRKLGWAFPKMTFLNFTILCCSGFITKMSDKSICRIAIDLFDLMLGLLDLDEFGKCSLFTQPILFL